MIHQFPRSTIIRKVIVHFVSKLVLLSHRHWETFFSSVSSDPRLDSSKTTMSSVLSKSPFSCHRAAKTFEALVTSLIVVLGFLVSTETQIFLFSTMEKNNFAVESLFWYFYLILFLQPWFNLLGRWICWWGRFLKRLQHYSWVYVLLQCYDLKSRRRSLLSIL